MIANHAADRLSCLRNPLSLESAERVWLVALFFLGLFVVPVLVSSCLTDPRGSVPWYQARRYPMGLAPDPVKTQEAVIQVYAAPAVSWRGIFAVHTWMAVKPPRRCASTGWFLTITGLARGRGSCSTPWFF